MQPDPRDAGYLWDMLDNARSVRRVASSASQERLIEDRDLQLLLERAIEIIDEAAGRVSPGFRNAHAEIPWVQIIGLRNVIVHEYGDIDYDLIWRVATHDVPVLIAALEPIVPPIAT